jgi:hypothetical protein
VGYSIKVQKVERPTNRSYYLNLRVALAEALDLAKTEEWEWSVRRRQDTGAHWESQKTAP